MAKDAAAYFRAQWITMSLTVMLATLTAQGEEIGLMTLDPAHFHAALFHKEMVPGISTNVHIYAPLGPDLLAHLQRVMQFNTRPVAPTTWNFEIHAGPGSLERMIAERPGNVVVLAGRNRGKVSQIAALANAGLHALIDKPWIIAADTLPLLEKAVASAVNNHAVLFDGMTQRYEISRIVQKELVNDPDVFGAIQPGCPAQPAVYMESVHYMVKEVAGVPLVRPPWFFDPDQQGECLVDAGPHLVDLVHWTLFPKQVLDHHREFEFLDASRTATRLTEAQFQKVTAQKTFPDYLHKFLRDGSLEYFARNRVLYRVRGRHVQLDTRWEYEAAPGGKDQEIAIFTGSKSRIEVRQTDAQSFVPEVYVVPLNSEDRRAIGTSLRKRVAELARVHCGLSVQEEENRFHIVIPAALRVDHEAHFSLLIRDYLRYVRNPASLPSWEMPNLLAKYYVTTKGLELARKKVPAP